MGPFEAAATRRTSILFQNADRDIYLIDIPTSIAVAQGHPDPRSGPGTLLSTPPLEVPYALLQDEPKTSAAKKNHSAHITAAHIEYRSAIHAALAEIRNHVSGAWCAPRKLQSSDPTPRKAMTPRIDSDTSPDDDALERDIESRLREWAALGERKGDDSQFDFQKMMASLGATGSDLSASASSIHNDVAHRWLASYRRPRELHDASGTSHPVQTHTVTEPWTSSFHNPEDYPLELQLQLHEDGDGDPRHAAEHDIGEAEAAAASAYRFTIPPHATAFLSDSTHSEAFRASFRDLTDDYNLPRHFDLVLLDPPWPNRSAKRKGAYEQVGGMPHMKRMLLKMDIDNYLEHNALVGVWITNKDAMRAHVLGPGGLFEKWNVGLVEEWIWVKVTTHGEPMFDIDSALRRPYEILLLGRAAPNAWTTMAHARVPRKKVIAAVPDVHSRKPCLKELLTPYLAADYSALEVFSRNLVAGWTSWGNEVIKFNWDRYWARDPE